MKEPQEMGLELAAPKEKADEFADLKKAQAANEALADVPSVFEVDGIKIELKNFTIDRIVQIDSIILRLSTLIREVGALREVESIEDFQELQEKLVDWGKEIKELIIEALFKIINADEENPVADRDWIASKIDTSPDGLGMQIVKAYQRHCNIVPFLTELLRAKQF